MQRDLTALSRFVERMQCVPRFLAQRNRRAGAGLSPEALEDLAQDVLTAIWRRLPDYRGEASLETWAYRFCELQLRNAVRRAAPRRAISLADLDEAEGPGAVDDPVGQRLEVADALALLAAEDAALLRLKHFEGLTFEEIGQRLSVSPNTIKTRYYRSLQTLGRLLDTKQAEA